MPKPWPCQVITGEPEGGPGWVSKGIVSGGHITPGRDMRVLRGPGRHWEEAPPGQHPGMLEGESRQECGRAEVIRGHPSPSHSHSRPSTRVLWSTSGGCVTFRQVLILVPMDEGNDQALPGVSEETVLLCQAIRETITNLYQPKLQQAPWEAVDWWSSGSRSVNYAF